MTVDTGSWVPSLVLNRRPATSPSGSPSLWNRPKASIVIKSLQLAATLRVVDPPFRQTVRLLFGSGRRKGHL